MQDFQEDIYYKDLLDLFEELSFKEKWKKVFKGLKMPKNTGDYKFAKLQMIRLISPISAITVPILTFFIICIFATITPEINQTYKTTIIEPTKIEKLEEIIEPIIEKKEIIPEDFDFSTEPQLQQNNNANPTPDYSPKPTEINAVQITKSPIIMKKIWGHRDSGQRGKAIDTYGGHGSQIAVLRALRWFKTIQQDNGCWKYSQSDPAMTSLAVLAYLAYGQTTSSEEFGYTVEKALQYLINQQKDNGKFKGADPHDYTHPIVTYGICEAYGMIKNPQLKYAAEKAIKIIIKGQNMHGGFNYNLKGNTDKRNDLSYIAWCVQALKAAKMAEIYVDGLEMCMKKSINGVKKNFENINSKNSHYESGYYSYSGNKVNTPMQGLSGAGALCMQFLNATEDPTCKKAINYLKQAKCSWNVKNLKICSQRPIYYWYYITQAKFQHSKEEFKTWNDMMLPTMTKNQTIIPKEKSNYEFKGKKREIGWWNSPKSTKTSPELMKTILSTLMLEVYYRYLPTFDKQQIEEVIEEDKDDADININII